MRRNVSLLLLFMMLASVIQPSVAFGENKESETKIGTGHWAEEALGKWKDLGLIQGDPSGSLQPDRSITRAEFAALVNRLFNLTDTSGGNFADVKQGQWYADDMAKARTAGYLTGYADRTVKPLSPITREEAAVVLQRVFKLDDSAVAATPLAFKDSDQIGQYAKKAIAQLATLGYVSGYQDGTFKGKQSITRAEAVSIMNRIASLIINKAGNVDVKNVEGNVLVNAAGVTLRNMNIVGDLYLTEGIGEGDVILDNVTVTGNTFIQGGGENSIKAIDSKLNAVRISKRNHKIHFILLGNSSADKVYANSGTILDNATDSGEGFGRIMISKSLPPKAKVRFIGRFTKVDTESGDGSNAEPVDILIDGPVDELILNFKANIIVSPTGSIGNLKIGSTASGSTLEGKIEKIDNAADDVRYQGKILPKTVDATAVPSSPGGNTSGTGPTVAAFTAKAIKGTAAGTTKVQASASSGLHLAVKVSHETIAEPAPGTKAPTGGTVTNPYVAGSDIGGVDGVINKYVGVYLLDASHNILKFQQVTLTEGEIAPKQWNLVWDDEFDGDGIDQSKWNYVEKGDGFGNSELQYYTARTENARVEEGSLIIEARKENYLGQQYTSAKLTTEDKGHWTSGKYEVRAKLPKGQGIWPAIWMMPQDMDTYGTWPASGEIDIMEQVGHEPQTVHGTLHYGTPHTSSGYSYSLPGGGAFADDYHVFTTEWEPGELRWYVDGVLYAVQNDWFSLDGTQPADYTYPAPFDRDFYMQLNVAVGGIWPGSPDATTSFSQKMLVDYVRVYEMDPTYGYRQPAEERPGQRDQGSVTPGKTPLADGNYIYNGTFDEDKPDVAGIPEAENSDYWTFRVGNNGAATVGNDNGAMKINVSDTGAANYSTQLIQQPVPLQIGKFYKVSFDAKASSERSIEVKLGSGGDGGWKDYAAQSFNLDTSMSRYEFVFKMQAFTHMNARLEMNLGGSTGSVWLDNIKLVETAGQSEQNRIPLTDGNYIYNGSFALGKGGMSYWTWLKSDSARATASVGTSVESKPFKATITNGGSTPEAVQLVQDNIFLKGNAYYVVSFDGAAEEATAVQIDVVDAIDGTNYSGVRTIPLGVDRERKQFYFRFDSSQDRNAKLRVLLGGGMSRSVTLDEFRIDERSVNRISTDPVFIQAEHYFYQSGITVLSETNGSTYVESFGTGDSLEYLVDIAVAGNYQFAYRAKSAGGAIQAISDEAEGGQTAIPGTSGSWQTVVSAPLALQAGVQMIKFKAISGEMSLNWIAIAQDGSNFSIDDSGNLIKNGKFNDDLAQWGFWTEASANVANDNGKLRVTANSVGGQSWSIQSTQSDISLAANTFYTLSFDASASVDRRIGVAIENAAQNRLMPDKTIDLQSSMTRYSFDFEMGAADPTGKLVFSLGNVGNAGSLGSHKIWIDNVKLQVTNKVASLAAAIEPGTVPGTTRVNAVAGGANHLAASIGNVSVPVPNYGDKLPDSANLVNPYLGGDNLFGANATTNKYLAIYEADANNRIVKYKQFVLTEQDILPAEATDPAELLAIASIQPGSSHATTRINAIAGAGNHLVAKVSHQAIATPNKGDRVPSGGTVVNPYLSGSDLSGVDGTTNKYVALYEADATQRVVKFKLVELTAANIKSENWQMVWSDEFDDSGIDPAKWNYV